MLWSLDRNIQALEIPDTCYIMAFKDNPIFINNIHVTECAIFISDEFQQFTFDWYVTQQQLL